MGKKSGAGASLAAKKLAGSSPALVRTNDCFSWIMPSLVGLAEEDPLLQIEVDASRNILFTRSEKGTLTVDLGKIKKR